MVVYRTIDRTINNPKLYSEKYKTIVTSIDMIGKLFQVTSKRTRLLLPHLFTIFRFFRSLIW